MNGEHPNDKCVPTSKTVTKQVEEGMRLRHAFVEEAGDKLSAARHMAYLSHLDRGELLAEVERLRSIINGKTLVTGDETSAVPSHEALADHLKTLTASTNCPVCGKSGMHEHTPTELIIYRNGVKYGRSLYETAPVGTPRIGQCEATVPPKWHTPEHRCEFEATTEINGQKLCGHHLKSSSEEPEERMCRCEHPNAKLCRTAEHPCDCQCHGLPGADV